MRWVTEMEIFSMELKIACESSHQSLEANLYKKEKHCTHVAGAKGELCPSTQLFSLCTALCTWINEEFVHLLHLDLSPYSRGEVKSISKERLKKLNLGMRLSFVQANNWIAPRHFFSPFSWNFIVAVSIFGHGWRSLLTNKKTSAKTESSKRVNIIKVNWKLANQMWFETSQICIFTWKQRNIGASIRWLKKHSWKNRSRMGMVWCSLKRNGE